MLKLAGELLEGQLADHMARLDAHTQNTYENMIVGRYYLPGGSRGGTTVVLADRIIAFPFIGLLSFISLGAYRAKQRLVRG